MGKDDLLLVFSFLILVFSIFGLVSSYNSLIEVSDFITGFASQSGIVNVSVSDYELVNFTSSNLINFGVGSVFFNSSFATIDTTGNIYNGTWSVVNGGFVIRNLGNVNVTLNFSTGKAADDFIGGSSPSYKYNISNVETGACIPPSGFDLNSFYETDASSVEVCEYFLPNSSINIDFKLVIPSNSNLGSLTDSVSIVHEASS